MRKCFIALAVSLACLSAWHADIPERTAGHADIPERTAEHADRPERTERHADRPERKASLIFTGDVLLDRGVRQVIERKGADCLFTEAVDSLFRSAQAVVGNLECPATKILSPAHKHFVFRAEPEWLQVLKAHGFTHLNLANNHSVDQGRRGLTDTWRNIREAGMVPVGAGKTMAEAAEPVLIARQPRPVWLVASLRLALENFAYLEDRPSVSQERMELLLKRVARLRRQDAKAVIVVSLHWGGEHTLKPTPSQRLEAHRLIDAGADVLICHHTHTLQTIEQYRGHAIYYSIGNFIFDQSKPLNAQACVVRLDVTADSLSTTTIPITIRNCKPHINTP